MPRKKTAGNTRTSGENQAQTRGRTARKPVPPKYDESRVRARAYELYLKRNNGPGDAMGDWLQAERELGDSLNNP